MEDWFRSPDWSVDAQQDFESRLRRARVHNRAQYLRIKSLSIEAAGHTDGAMDLLRRIVQDYSDRRTEVAFAHERLGDLLRTNDRVEAEAEYRLAIATSPNLSGTSGLVHLKLGEILIESGPEAVAEVERLLSAARSHLRFNSCAFRFNVLAAHVAGEIGDLDRRRRFASAALALVDAPPQLSRTPTVGLVSAPASLLAELETMAGS